MKYSNMISPKEIKEILLVAMNKFKSEVTVTVDEDYDIGYIYFKSPWGSSETQRSVRGDCNIILDFDAEGHIIGIETLRASKHIHPIMRAPSKTLSEVVAELRAVQGSGWKDIDDPLAELRRLRGGDEISGVDAHFLLFAIDAYVATDPKGRVTEPRDGLSREGWQRIRDRLFEMHEHPVEEL